MLKSQGCTLAKLKDDYKALLKQAHCFLSLAPFDADFKDAQARFEAGENRYLILPAADERADEDGDEDAEDRIQIRVVKASPSSMAPHRAASTPWQAPLSLSSTRSCWSST